MPTIRYSLICAVGLLVTPGIAQAGGFGVDEQDAAATGRGGTAGARAEASSAYYNPAGLTGVGPLQVQLGATAIAPAGTATYQGVTTHGTSKVYLPPYLYAAHREGNLAFGVALNAPFGLGAGYPGDFPDRFEVQSVEFQTLAVTGALAYQLAEPFSLGVTLGAQRTSFDLTQKVDFVSQEGTAHLLASGWGLVAIFGARYTVGEVAAFGLSGSLPSPTSMSGTARFKNVPVEFGPLTNDQDITTQVTLPARLRGGFSYRPVVPVHLDLDVAYTLWSSFAALNIAFTDPRTPAAGQVKTWRNGLTVHAGGEYALPAIADLRAGISYDQAVAPVSTLGPDAPDGDRWQFSLGAGRALFDGLRADLAYAYLSQATRTSEAPNFPATFTGHAHLVALSLSFKLPTPDAHRVVGANP
jgi:long-chain fatty acid transport protein